MAIPSSLWHLLYGCWNYFPPVLIARSALSKQRNKQNRKRHNFGSCLYGLASFVPAQIPNLTFYPYYPDTPTLVAKHTQRSSSSFLFLFNLHISVHFPTKPPLNHWTTMHVHNQIHAVCIHTHTCIYDMYVCVLHDINLYIFIYAYTHRGVVYTIVGPAKQVLAGGQEGKIQGKGKQL